MKMISDSTPVVPLVQVMVILMSDGTFQFGLPNLVSSIQDRIFIVGLLEQASRAADRMPLQQQPGGVLLPSGQPVPDLRGEDR